MAIGIVSDDELQNELEKLNPVPNPNSSVVIKEKHNGGRASGDVNVPDSLRKIIGETSAIDGRQEALALAELFDISPSSVSAYANGTTSTTKYHEPSPPILAHINKSRERAVRKAGKKLNSALDEISDEKLKMLGARELAGVAKDMSAVIKNLEPKQELVDDGAKAPQFVIFAPQFVKEEKFETIVLNE